MHLRRRCHRPNRLVFTEAEISNEDRKERERQKSIDGKTTSDYRSDSEPASNEWDGRRATTDPTDGQRDGVRSKWPWPLSFVSWRERGVE